MRRRSHPVSLALKILATEPRVRALAIIKRCCILALAVPIPDTLPRADARLAAIRWPSEPRWTRQRISHRSHPSSRHKAADEIGPIPDQSLSDRVAFAGDDRVVGHPLPIFVPLRMPRHGNVITAVLNLPIGTRTVGKSAARLLRSRAVASAGARI